MEVAMKKFFLALSMLLCATASTLLSMSIYTPASGVIQLGGLPSFDPNGTIMKTILHDPNFEEERTIIKKFLNTTTINQNYQSIIAAIYNAPANMPGALESLEAFERAIMNYVHSENYIILLENKWLNIFVTGIRWSWVNPKCWLMPSYWVSDNSKVLEQCMQELSNLSKIAEKFSIVTSTRMKATVESYLNWRRNIAIFIGTCLTTNLIYNGWNKSTLKMLKNGGISNLNKVIVQTGKDIYDFTNYSSNTIYKGTVILKNWVQPIINVIVYGDQTSTDNQPDNENQTITSTINQENCNNSIQTTTNDIVEHNNQASSDNQPDNENQTITSTINQENCNNSIQTATNDIVEHNNQASSDKQQNTNERIQYENISNNLQNTQQNIEEINTQKNSDSITIK